MIAHKHSTKIVLALMAVTLCLCLLAMGFSGPLAAALGGAGVSMTYEDRLFDPASPITVNIRMDETQWNAMLANAMAEEYYSCDVEIAGQTFYQVGIRPKGNTSLSSIASDPNTDRYSFKLEFDRFVEGQTCFGLDKLVLNNNYADATNMKEALVYDMFRFLGADTSLYNYAKVCVNGEYWGVYLALEAVEDSFLLRNYGVRSGKLYKPESMGRGGRGAAPGQGMGSGGADLNYTDDDPDSYATIWEGEVTGASGADHRRVVTALKNIAAKEDLARYMDVDNLLRYMAVHVFSENEDSLSGSMAHNYYLYEADGRLNLLPWDYNLALGGMFGGRSASGTVNGPIDDSFGSTSFFDGLLEDEAYRAQYHDYMGQLVEQYVFGGGFETFYANARAVLDDLVAADPTAFYTFNEYQNAAEMLYTVVRLRGQSIAGQLDGSIPSTSAGQRANSASLINTGTLDLSVMGTMNMGNGAMGGGGGFGKPFGQGQFAGFDPGQNGAPGTPGDATPPAGFDPGQNAGQPPAGFDPGQNAGPGGSKQDGFRPPQMPGQNNGGRPGAASGSVPSAALGGIVIGVSFGLLLAALVFALRSRQRSRRK